jgi:hypothetical protein
LRCEKKIEIWNFFKKKITARATMERAVFIYLFFCCREEEEDTEEEKERRKNKRKYFKIH